MRRAGLLELEVYRPELKALWDTLVRSAKNGSFQFFRDYMEYHADRFQDHSLIVLRDGKPVACLPAHAEGATLASHNGLTWGGLVMHPTLRSEDVAAIFDLLGAHMKAMGFGELLYRPMPYPYHRMPAEEDLCALHGLGPEVFDSRATSVVRAGTLAPRNKYFTTSARSKFRIQRDDDVAGFMTLVADFLATRHGATPVHTKEEMLRLTSLFPANIEIYSAADDAVISAVMIYRNPTCARAQYLADTEHGRRLDAVTAIYHHIIMDVLDAGTWFDFGPSVSPGGELNRGVLNYKEGLGGRTVQLKTFRLPVH